MINEEKILINTRKLAISQIQSHETAKKVRGINPPTMPDTNYCEKHNLKYETEIDNDCPMCIDEDINKEIDESDKSEINSKTNK